MALGLLSSCSSTPIGGDLRDSSQMFSFRDVTGKYRLNREIKVVKKKTVTRVQLLSEENKLLEKSVVVSQMGSVREKNKRVLSMRPYASEFTVWLEGKKYTSTMKIDPKSKSMRVELDSPEPKWKGVKTIPFPGGKVFCFYSQLPECLNQAQLLKRANNDERKKINFTLVWDNWPYVQDQLTGVGQELFTPATLTFERMEKKNLRFTVEVEGQMLLLSFSNSYDLVRIAWVAQGISVLPLGEDVPNDE